ncbi:50S ribosomal protein L32 [Candidatus Woesebacteria bacterium CG07_land_8_20_14_0_80_44_9]|uniref:Large ribosomal subunit protein bL32 n=1 Tax=Candidatus Woesebacteria bacterium CG07_land_8_20_14_0_80_44_9 TaxID=1975058 RepID=A0A2M6YEN3_9BACT|nr:MAG: 50S ribosomal protein L32 [Candidatus Woesebacteria bacterium CG07_land_8_20_14_0_80_44_9]
MTPLPKKKHTRSRSGKRRNAATNKLKLANLTRCSNCKKLRMSHVACPSCGHYK